MFVRTGALPEVLHTLAKMIDAERGSLMVLKGAGSIGTASRVLMNPCSGCSPKAGLDAANSRQGFWACAIPAFSPSMPCFTPEELDEEPLWRDFFRPAGFGWGAGTLVSVASGDQHLLSPSTANSNAAPSKRSSSSNSTICARISRAAC